MNLTFRDRPHVLLKLDVGVNGQPCLPWPLGGQTPVQDDVEGVSVGDSGVHGVHIHHVDVPRSGLRPHQSLRMNMYMSMK